VIVSDRILVFIPCYNCAPQIGRVLAQFQGPIASRFAEILVLDNRSRDGTVEAAIAGLEGCETPRVTIARNLENYNLGGSHKAAFAYARRLGFTHLAVLHGDDQGAIADLEPVLSTGTHQRFDACLGARFAPGARLVGYSRFRIFGNHVFNALTSFAARRRVWDLGSGLNIFALDAISDTDIRRYADDLRFNLFLLFGLIDARKSLRFFPISWREADQISNVKIVSLAMKTLRVIAEYAVRRRRFRLTDFRTESRERYEFEVVHARLAPVLAHS
jgi:dolichol-phosphate mannosyltransferase